MRKCRPGLCRRAPVQGALQYRSMVRSTLHVFYYRMTPGNAIRCAPPFLSVATPLVGVPSAHPSTTQRRTEWDGTPTRGVATGSYQPRGPPRRPPVRLPPPHHARLRRLATIINKMIGTKMNPIEFPKNQKNSRIKPDPMEMKMRTSMIQPKRKEPRRCCWGRAQGGAPCP